MRVWMQIFEYRGRKLKVALSEELSRKIWKEERFPERWTQDVIIPKKRKKGAGISQRNNAATVGIQNICIGSGKQIVEGERNSARVASGVQEEKGGGGQYLCAELFGGKKR